MPKRACCRCWWCVSRCRPKAGKFWNNFCKSPTRWTYVILFLVIVNLFHWVFFAAFTINFGSLSYYQHSSYIFTCISGLLLFITALFVMHAINVLWPSRLRVTLIEIGLFITLLLMVASLSTFLYTPTREEIRDHIFDYYMTHGRNPVFMQDIEFEKKCCGVFSFKDYLQPGKDFLIEGVQIPRSCCKKQVGICKSDEDEREFMNEHNTIIIEHVDQLQHFHLQGCIIKGYWDLIHSATKSFTKWIIYFACTLFHLLSCVFIIVIFNYYICYDFPSRRTKCKTVHRHIEAVYRERDGIIEEATSNLEVAEYAIEGPAILEWYNMHYLPKWGAYGNIDRMARDGFALPKRFEFPLFPFDEYKNHPETFKTGTNLDLYEGTKVYESPPPEKVDPVDQKEQGIDKEKQEDEKSRISRWFNL